MVHNYKLCSSHGSKPYITHPEVELVKSWTADTVVSDFYKQQRNNKNLLEKDGST